MPVRARADGARRHPISLLCGPRRRRGATATVVVAAAAASP